MQQRGDIRAEFERLARQWREETRFVSSSTKMFTHPAYRRIVALGEAAVPLILEDLATRGADHWGSALSEITGEHPVSADQSGQVKNIAHTWLEWGRRKGLVS